MDWDGIRMLDRATIPVQLKLKEASHIERTPTNNRFGGYELQGYWIVTMKKLGGGATTLMLVAPTASALNRMGM